jgi:type IV pilus assembly protein PilQ
MAILAVAVMSFLVPAIGQQLTSDIKVSLNFDDTPIKTVLSMLAAQNSLNLVVSSDVEGDISIKLDNVTLGAALDAILQPNGYNYHIGEDIIIIKAADKKVVGELVAQTYRLKFIDASVAEAALKPMLSDNGTAVPIQASKAQNGSDKIMESTQIVVFDYPDVHLLVSELLTHIDTKRRQVMVEVKIIETNLTEDEKLGINWPKAIASSITGVASPQGASVAGDDNNGVAEMAVMPLENGNWQLGYLTLHQVDIVLDFLQQRKNTKLLSNPRLTAMENEIAVIEVQTVIPIQTINRFSEGAVIQDIVTFQDEEVGISLKVTPRINDDSTITMRVNPVVEEIVGFSGPADNQKPITSERSISTSVTVGNNETIVLGGLLKETRFDAVEKVFLLGSIPLLGGLFTHKSTETQTTDLLIMITPHIIE